MKKTVTLILIFLFCFTAFAQLSFEKLDLMVSDKSFWQQGYAELEQMLENSDSANERGEILWRLSRFACIIGDSQEKTSDKRFWFEKGLNNAQTGISENPENYMCYMWHCANKGRDIQTRSIMAQASGVKVLLDDLTAVLDTLNQTQLSEAWQALGEIYLNHPFKSTSSAVSFFRVAVDTIPENEIRLIAYRSLADALHSRNWSASKRKTEIAKEEKDWNKSYSSNISQYENYEGKNGVSFVPLWATQTLGELSDRQEEQLVLLYAEKIYNKAINETDKNSKEKILSDSDIQEYEIIVKKIK